MDETETGHKQCICQKSSWSRGVQYIGKDTESGEHYRSLLCWEPRDEQQVNTPLWTSAPSAINKREDHYNSSLLLPLSLWFQMHCLQSAQAFKCRNFLIPGEGCKCKYNKVREEQEVKVLIATRIQSSCTLLKGLLLTGWQIIPKSTYCAGIVRDYFGGWGWSTKARLIRVLINATIFGNTFNEGAQIKNASKYNETLFIIYA